MQIKQHAQSSKLLIPTWCIPHGKKVTNAHMVEKQKPKSVNPEHIQQGIANPTFTSMTLNQLHTLKQTMGRALGICTNHAHDNVVCMVSSNMTSGLKKNKRESWT